MYNNPSKQTSHQLTVLAIRLILNLLLCVGWLATGPTAHAATLTVTNVNDTGSGSLRQTILDADPGDTIVFDPSLKGSTITLGDEIVIGKDLTVTGLGAAELTISGGGNSRVFNVTSGASVTISEMTIRDGAARMGGGVYNAGTLTLTDCVLTNNTAPTAQGSLSVNGGGVINAASVGAATLTIERCVIENNTSESEGGGVGNVTYTDSVADLTVRDSTIINNHAEYGGGVAIYAQNEGAANATFVNTTVSGNTATSDGGGYDLDILSDGIMVRLTLINTTVYSNTADRNGGGVSVIAAGSSLILRNSIVAGNSAGETGDDIRRVDEAADVVFYGGNVIGSDEGIGLYSHRPTDQIGTSTSAIDPLLGPLDDNGGPTQTHIPQTSSPAIDAGEETTCPSLDQRGEARPIDGDGDGSPGCDSGAVEVQPNDLASVKRCDLAQGETTYFRATGVSAEIVTPGSLACVEVTLHAENHPQATGAGDGEALRTGRYWTITETASAADWAVNLSLLHEEVLNPQACKYPGTIGGAGWDCDADAATDRYVARNNVTSFSDWAVGSDVSPTSVFLRSFSAGKHDKVGILTGVTSVVGLGLLAGVWRVRRKR